MKITILSPDLSNNCLIRAHLLASVLQRRYEVEIVGPSFGKGIWSPLAHDTSIQYHFIKLKGLVAPYRQLSALSKQISGDVVYASKPLFTSFGVGMLKKIREHTPLILDIDDWERGFTKYIYAHLPVTRRAHFLAISALFPYGMGSAVNCYLSEKFVPAADALTVSNTFLRARFGGELIYHGRDTAAYDPKKLDPESIREQHNIAESDKIVMFTGMPRRHKGLEELVKSIRLIQDANVKLFLVGIDMTDGYCVELVKMATELLGTRFVGIEQQHFASMPAWLSIADVIAIPQKRNAASLGQMPAKVFDAMAMAKPIVATNVNDLPRVLLNCGWIVEPDDLNLLSTTIRYVLTHPDDAKEMGNRAREECIRKYSWNALEAILVRKFQTYESD